MADADKTTNIQVKKSWGKNILILVLAIAGACAINLLYQMWENGLEKKYVESSRKEVAQYMSLKTASEQDWIELKRSNWQLYKKDLIPDEVCQEVVRKHKPTGIIQTKYDCLPEEEAAEMIKKGLVK
ncbi:MAG: hypothetical protein A2351_07755 [Omnitrophica bacterium RIFOXYB12_FULL_50_7]|nr:MAG: hypothetical protein A2351_07755 [Omnitrophica bacterium RIFOXYB12_FULL_50_7]